MGLSLPLSNFFHIDDGPIHSPVMWLVKGLIPTLQTRKLRMRKSSALLKGK